MIFKFIPFEKVFIKALECEGRIARCILDGGPQPIYGVDYIVNSDLKRNEFYQDELTHV